jgi:hypothetical protein
MNKINTVEKLFYVGSVMFMGYLLAISLGYWGTL